MRDKIKYVNVENKSIINIGFNLVSLKFKIQLKSIHELWGHTSIINNIKLPIAYLVKGLGR